MVHAVVAQREMDTPEQSCTKERVVAEQKWCAQTIYAHLGPLSDETCIMHTCGTHGADGLFALQKARLLTHVTPGRVTSHPEREYRSQMREYCDERATCRANLFRNLS